MKFSNKMKDLKGKRFGKLKIIKFSNKLTKFGGTIWECKCECGKIIERSSSSLKDSERENRKISCGCLQVKKLGESAISKLFIQYKIRAKRKNISFNLSRKKFIELTSSNCHYCGQEPNRIIQKSKSRGKYLFNGIDRKNNKLGYSIKNCVSCCKICNFAKHTMSYKKFIGWLNKICEFRSIK